MACCPPLLDDQIMFDYTLAHWAAFVSATMLLNLSPGPDLAYILGQTMRHGQRAGFVAVMGIWTGAFVHVALAALGLSAVLAASDAAFSLVKWLGAGYLIWLGIQALRSDGQFAVEGPGAPPRARGHIFRQGMLVSALNPKLALFFLAFLPQFVVAEAGPVGAQLALHGSLVIVLAAFVEVPAVILGGRLSQAISRHRRAATWVDRGLGSLFIALGLRLAFVS
jgi:threonine/homoserine/homoserine lactone efflux protein